jgi:DNA-directed RNA polymerase subunit RPC12/RpoP
VKWRCAWCSREYDSDDPPCETCGHETFEPVSAATDSTFESGSLVWVCTDCGREHVKHSPPCSRCGSHSLEKRESDASNLDDISSPGYLTVGKPYLAGVVVVLGLVVLVVTGVVPFPGIGGPPAPPDAPGDGDQSGGLDLSAVESELHDRFETERASAGAPERELGGDGTGTYIEYRTRHRVAERYDSEYDGSMPDASAFDLQCGSQPRLGVATSSVGTDSFDDESAFADALADDLLTTESFREAVLSEAESEGITVHVGPDGTVFVGYMAC